MSLKTHYPTRCRLAAVVALALCLAGGSTARAAGLLIADGGFGGQLEIEEHVVDVTLNNGIAVTEVTQVFRNLENRQLEALYTFPVPEGASVSNFSMWIGGKEMIGEVLEKKRAREIYDSYKRRRIDPGLLEQKDYKTFEMRIFPIQPRAEQKVKITYYQELDHDGDWVTYVYPLATVTHADLDSRTRGTFRINVDARSEISIVSMESPSHQSDFVIAPHSEDYYQASLETPEGELNRDVVLTYKLSREKTGMDILTSRVAGEDGYFCIILTAGEDLAKLDVGMDFVFVLDISGSMSHGDKLRLSRGSLGAFIDTLGEDDRFELITFNVRPEPLFNKLQDNSVEFRQSAHQFLASQQAKGGTVLASAMEAAYRYGDPDRQLNVVVLSDGMTQQGERSELYRMIQKRPSHARVFCIGVGNEVNRPLLEQLAEEAGGLASFISRGDNFSRQAKFFRRKLTRPAAANVRLDFGGKSVYDVEPRRLPNLFHGTPMRVYGRYREAGEIPVTVEADLVGREFNKSFTVQLPREDNSNPEIERMWAWKKIDRLLKGIDRGGRREEILRDVVFLGETYSIASEYTSFLVLENNDEYRRWKIERRNMRRLERDRRARTRVASALEKIRERAVSGIGPGAVRSEEPAQPVEVTASPVPTSSPSASRAPRARTPTTSSPSTPRRGRRGIDFGLGGGGPVGPIFVAAAVWMASRKRRRGTTSD